MLAIYFLIFFIGRDFSTLRRKSNIAYLPCLLIWDVAQVIQSHSADEYVPWLTPLKEPFSDRGDKDCSEESEVLRVSRILPHWNPGKPGCHDPVRPPPAVCMQPCRGLLWGHRTCTRASKTELLARSRCKNYFSTLNMMPRGRPVPFFPIHTFWKAFSLPWTAAIHIQKIQDVNSGKLH